MLQDQIGTLSDAAASTADKEAALAELQVLVEPIDNANGEGACFHLQHGSRHRRLHRHSMHCVVAHSQPERFTL